jgi:putative oxidoreductase
MKSTTYFAERILSLLAAVILLQTLYFKFTAHPDSVYIFTKLGAEPYGRIGSGVLELIVGILLIFQRTSIYGAIAGLGIISGAILSHLLVLGINVQNDGGKLFFLAVLVFVACLGSIIVQWSKLKSLVFYKLEAI